MTEAEIRAALIAKLAATPAGHGAAFIVEMFLDGFARRADLVMANGKLAAFEIKSVRDTLDRLEGQLESYQRFFEQVTIVCAEKHVAAVKLQAPQQVGITAVTRGNKLTAVRAPKTVAPSLAAWISFLPVDELRVLLREHGLRSAGTRDDLVLAADALPLSAARSFVLTYLKRRQARIDALVKKKAERRVAEGTQTISPTDRLAAFMRQSQEPGSLMATPRQTSYSEPSIASSASPPSARRLEKSS